MFICRRIRGLPGGDLSLNMWMREDIRNILLALELSSAQSPLSGDVDAAAYRRGFRAALAATAVGFGIPLADLGLDARYQDQIRALLPGHVTVEEMR